MKTSTLLIAAGAVGVLVMLSKSRGSGLGDLGREWGAIGDKLPPSAHVGDTCIYTVRGVSRPYYVSRINTTRAGASPAWEIDTAREQREKQEAERYATLQRQIEAQATAARVAAQEQVNATLLAIQKRADEEMAAREKAEQDRLAAQAKADAEAQAKAAADAEARRAIVQQQMQTLPERITSVQTPSATILPEITAQPKQAGDSKVGLLVGGGVLAAIAAALAS